jgi:hypothetical protein
MLQRIVVKPASNGGAMQDICQEDAAIDAPTVFTPLSSGEGGRQGVVCHL